MPLVPLTRDGPVAAPLDYVVPQQGELLPVLVRAVLDGTSAAVAWYAVVEIIAPSGRIMGIGRSDSIAAGASADVSWFPLRRESAGQPGPSPNPLGTLWAWWDFSDTSTITLDGSSKIAAIADKTGNGHDAAAPAAGNRPAESTLNGLNCGLFNSAAFTVLVASGWSATLASPFTYFVVWTQTIASSNTYQPGPVGGWEITGDDSPPILFDNFNNSKLVMEAGPGSVAANLAAPYTQQQATMIFNGAGSIFRLNGVVNTGTTNEKPITNVALGASHWPNINSPDTQNMDGKLGEVLIYSGALSTTQVAAVEAYLKAKWATP